MNEEFKNILTLLDEEENAQVVSKNIDTPLKLIPLLLKRVHPKNVKVLAMIIKQSLLPSICLKTNEEIDQLFSQIEKNTSLLFDKNIQEKIEEFTTKRFERDKQVVIERTSDISKLVFLMEEYFNKTIDAVVEQVKIENPHYFEINSEDSFRKLLYRNIVQNINK